MRVATEILLFHPAEIDTSPTIDNVTHKMAYLLFWAKKSPTNKGRYDPEKQRFIRGSWSNRRVCRCGAIGTSHDYVIGIIDGKLVVTSSLAVHYLAYHRTEVSQEYLDLLEHFENRLLGVISLELLLIPSWMTG